MTLFKFGVFGELSPPVALGSVLAVIGFILMAEFIIGFLEFTLDESPLYGKMVKLIYRELMLMGIISFILTMYEALFSDASTVVTEKTIWLEGIEISHMFLFFLAIFFMTHAGYLMRMSIRVTKELRQLYLVPMKTLLTDLANLNDSSLARFLYRITFTPITLSPVRDRAEFKVLQCLFQDTYKISVGFDFAAYLQGCLERYSLKTIEIGPLNWAVVVIIVVLNYFRSQGSGIFDCTRVQNGDMQENIFSRRMLYTFVTPSAPREHPFLCYVQQLELFLLCGCFLCFYCLVLLVFARIYHMRLINRVGINGPEDYFLYLQFYETETKKAERNKKLQSLGVVVDNFTNTLELMSLEKLRTHLREYQDVNEAGVNQPETAKYRLAKSIIVKIAEVVSMSVYFVTSRIGYVYRVTFSFVWRRCFPSNDRKKVGSVGSKTGGGGTTSYAQ